MVWIQLAVMLGFIYLGARLGGVGLGLAGGFGVAVLVFVFRLKPTSAPIDVMLIMLAVVTAAGALQAAGGMDLMVRWAERLLRRNPKRITFMAPIVTWFFTFIAGTGHVAYSVLPVIAEVAREVKVRPERAMSVATIASQQAIVGSPVSAAMAAMVALTADSGMTLPKLMLIAAPATFMGSMIAAFVMNFYGKEMEDDPEYKRRLAAGLIAPPAARKDEQFEDDPKALRSVIIFVLAAVAVVICGMFPALRPSWMIDGTLVRLDMSNTIQLVMLAGGALICLACKADLNKLVKGSVFTAGIIAVIGVFGIAWMGDTWFNANATFLRGGMQGLVTSYPWVFAFVLFALSALIFSQAATTRALMPIGLSLGIPAPLLAAMMPAVNGYFFLPTYGTLIAAINFDTTGTTRIGKFVINHSFQVPGLVATICSVTIGFALQALFW